MGRGFGQGHGKGLKRGGQRGGQGQGNKSVCIVIISKYRPEVIFYFEGLILK